MANLSLNWPSAVTWRWLHSNRYAESNSDGCTALRPLLRQTLCTHQMTACYGNWLTFKISVYRRALFCSKSDSNETSTCEIFSRSLRVPSDDNSRSHYWNPLLYNNATSNHIRAKQFRSLL